MTSRPITHAYALGKCYLVERVDVTDEMVERAVKAMCWRGVGGTHTYLRETARDVLAAALGEENER